MRSLLLVLSSTPQGQQKKSSGFSLVEVVMALGIISFALVALIGLLPAGLSAHRQATNQASCIQALSELSDAARAIYATTNGVNKYPAALSAFTPGVAESKTYTLLANGQLSATAGGDARGTVYIRQYPVTANNLIPLYISVAWPSAASRVGENWKAAQGYVETCVYVLPP